MNFMYCVLRDFILHQTLHSYNILLGFDSYKDCLMTMSHPLHFQQNMQNSFGIVVLFIPSEPVSAYAQIQLL